MYMYALIAAHLNTAEETYPLTTLSERKLSSSTVVHAKMGHASQTTPLLGVHYHPFGKTWYNLPMY